LPLWLVGSLGLMGIGIGLSAGWLQPSVPHRTGDQIAAEALTMPFQLAGGNRCGIAVKVTPIRFFWIQMILHSYTVESFAITSLKNERWVLHIDGGALRRDVPYHAAHNRTTRRHIGRFVDFGPWVLSLFFHELSGLDPRMQG
jgi:hypothetical protein